MDQIDKMIINFLRDNCRVSLETLAQECSITANAVKKRIEKLMDLGVIDSYVLKLSLDMIDGVYLIGIVNTDKNEDSTEFIDQIGEYPMVTHSFYESSGMCVLFAEVPGMKGLSELSAYIRGLANVEGAEFHVLPMDRGGRIKLGKSHLKVLRSLRNSPRMAVSTIARETGLTARRVKRIINELYETRAIRFTIHLTLNAGGSTMFVVRVSWNEKQTNATMIAEWFSNEYPVEYWYHYQSASDSILWAILVVDHIRDAEPIVRGLQQIPSVELTSMVIPYPEKRFKGLGIIALDEILEPIDG
ncbi:MAG: winged helix-turn-helix transcriptional regulator [Candidatus Thorarchaeota archaeon]